MANKENRSPLLATQPPMHSPNNKPALRRQRDHSSCRIPETPLKVRKTRGTLGTSISADIPPPCMHMASPGSRSSCATEPSPPAVSDEHSTVHDDSEAALVSVSTPTGLSLLQRQKSASRRVLSRVRQGIAIKAKGGQVIRPIESETSLLRRLSGRRQRSDDVDFRARSFDLAREAIIEDDHVRPPPPPIACCAERSFTDSTMATTASTDMSQGSPPASATSVSTELLLPPVCEEDLPLSTGSSPASPSLEPTPRPRQIISLSARTAPPRRIVATTPCVQLEVAMECQSVDASSKRDVWVAIEATVGTKASVAPGSASSSDLAVNVGSNQPVPVVQSHSLCADDSPDSAPTYDCGKITSLRLCYKAIGDCRIREVAGQKALRDLRIGQRCSLFIKVHVPKLRVHRTSHASDQDSLFTELESLVGMLEVDLLHVEARYRHSMLPTDNVVAVRYACRIRRPDSSSRWSIIETSDGGKEPRDVYGRLGRYLSTQYPTNQALEVFDSLITAAADGEATGVRRVRDDLAAQASRDGLEYANTALSPALVVTEADIDTTASSHDPSTGTPPTSASASTFQSHRSQEAPTAPPGWSLAATVRSTSLLSPPRAPPLLSAPDPMMGPATVRRSAPSATSCCSGILADPRDEAGTDGARRLWQDLRRASLSAAQLADATPERLRQLETADAGLGALRRTALANKRSVGAETLKAWRWEERVLDGKDTDSEAPWL